MYGQAQRPAIHEATVAETSSRIFTNGLTKIMTYDALTIDTQTVYRNGRRLNGGLVGQLEQYRDGLVQFILSEIVHREINSMLVVEAKLALDALSKGMRVGVRNGQVAEEHKLTLTTLLAVMSTPEEHAKNQLKAFVTSTGALMVPADKAPMNLILGAYFSKAPPFSNKGKKSEFPDAISLLSIEAWAKEEGKKVLAVSNDGDWKAFAEKSTWIDCIDNLGTALAVLTAAADSAKADAKAVLASLADGTAASSKTLLENELSHSIELETPYVEFSSSMEAEDEGASLSLIAYAFSESNLTEVDIVRVRSSGFVMRVPVEIKARAFADISFFSYDSVDKDYMSLGSTSVEREIDFNAFALIECELNSDGADGKSPSTKYGVKGAQLVGVPASIDLGHIEPSYGDEDFITEFSYFKE